MSWSKTPPTEEGWYWYKSRRTYADWYARPVLLYNRYGPRTPGRLWILGIPKEVTGPRDDCLWWSEPIKQPDDAAEGGT